MRVIWGTKDDASEALRALRETEILGDVPEADLRRLAESMRCAVHSRKEMIRAERVREHALLVRRGAIRVFRGREDGSEATLVVIREGEYAALSPAAASVASRSAMEAVQDETAIYAIPRAGMQAVMVRHPQTAVRMLDDQGRRLSELSDRFEELALYPVRARLARELARVARAEGSRDIFLTHQEVASRIGANQVTVTRQLEELRREGLIESKTRRQGIRIVAAGQLASYGG